MITMLPTSFKRLDDSTGATAVYVAIVLAVLIMFTALAIDVNHLYGVRNELHNAADAGSLAGAAVLLDTDGTLNRDAAILEAQRIATRNSSGSQAIEVGDLTVETGHWSFTQNDGQGLFTPNDSPHQLSDWQEMSFTDLDTNTAFINAVRVRVDRIDTPSFFARIFGINQFLVNNDAVAYRGFTGDAPPGTFDQPIAICEESITDEDSYSCNMGRMLNSGGNTATSNTGGWTNFTQPCSTSSASDMRALVCASGNQDTLRFGEGIGSTGGVQQSTLADLYDCWEAATNKITNWSLTLPVVECPGNNVSNCATLVGAVTVDVVWIIEQNDPQYDDVPREMTVGDDYWTCSDPNGFTCWQSFVDHFNLANVDGPPDPDNPADYEEMYQNKNIFFLPSCEVHEPMGNSGGQNFGILAEIPKLVE